MLRMFNRSDSLSEAFSDILWTRYANLLVNVSVSLRLNPKMVHYYYPWPLSSTSGLLNPKLLLQLQLCGTAFCLSDEKDLELIGAALFVLPINFNNLSSKVKFEYLTVYWAATELGVLSYWVHKHYV
jgi:hypothetical protein